MIYIASDHAGIELKKTIFEYLKKQGSEVVDCGPHIQDPEDDYPDFIYPCAVLVAKNPGSMGIVIGGSGQGEAFAANKVKGIRAALYYGGTKEIVRLSREHNDTNILSLAGRLLSPEEAKEAVDIWLSTKFDQTSRHQRRHDKIKEFEQ